MMVSQRVRLVFGLAAVLVVCSVAAGWQLVLATKIAEPRKGAAVSIVSQLNFRYDPRFIWSTLVSEEGLAALTGCALEPADRERSLTAVGDSLPGSIANQKGRLIVTGFENHRELRLVFEPDDATYLMHKRFTVATAGNGCVLQYWSVFTDFGATVDDKAANERQKISEAANAFRALVESQVKPNQLPAHGR